MSETLTNTWRSAIAYTHRELKFDLTAGLIVFLVAIPLCLGIALASGAPLFAGLLSGVIGGIVVGSLSGSQVSVSGPAAGMAAVVVSALVALGDFNTFLLAVLISGIIQIIVGIMRAGFIAEYVPSNVVQGLLCAIGILLIVKQLPLAFTLSADFNELQKYLLETTEGLSLSPLYVLTYHLNSGAAIISIISLTTLIFFEKTTIKSLQNFPATILVVLIGIIINELFVLTDSLFMQHSEYLVNIPHLKNVSEILMQIQFPNWNAFTNMQVYFYGFILAAVASLESLLNVKAGEKLDKKHRICSKDQELIAQGAGNFLSGLIGGLPITSVIVRTSVNIQSGAKTKAAAVFHGIFLLSAVLLIPQILNKIPLACLASILIHTGFKLTKPAIYRDIYKQGLSRFIPFLSTVISIVLFNVLLGVLIGLAISFFLSSKPIARHA